MKAMLRILVLSLSSCLLPVLTRAEESVESMRLFLIDTLESPEVVDGRVEAIGAGALHHDPETILVVIKTIETNPQFKQFTDKREEAVRALEALGRGERILLPQEAKFFITCLGDEEPRIRDTAAESLGRTPDELKESASIALAKATYDRNLDVVYNAMKSLGMLRHAGPGVVERLGQIAVGDFGDGLKGVWIEEHGSRFNDRDFLTLSKEAACSRLMINMDAAEFSKWGVEKPQEVRETVDALLATEFVLRSRRKWMEIPEEQRTAFLDHASRALLEMHEHSLSEPILYMAFNKLLGGELQDEERAEIEMLLKQRLNDANVAEFHKRVIQDILDANVASTPPAVGS